jgi:hypothetical protein
MNLDFQLGQHINSTYLSRIIVLFKHLIPIVLFFVLVSHPTQARSSYVCSVIETCTPSLANRLNLAKPDTIYKLSTSYEISFSTAKPGETCCQKRKKIHPISNSPTRLASSNLLVDILIESENILFSFSQKNFKKGLKHECRYRVYTNKYN